jgi:hypothetical protein
MGGTQLRILLFMMLIAVSRGAWAYPNYISYGYQSCMGCHYNPMGNGPLTDYGRAVAATELTDRQLWSASAHDDDEKLADRDGFLWRKPSNNWFRPSASYRGLFLETNPGQVAQKSQWINMDASAALVAKFLTNDKLIFVGEIGYAPVPLETQGDGKSYANYRSREYYIGYRFVKEFGLYVGLMDKAFGIRVPDHITFSRVVTRNNEDDQVHGILAHYLAGNLEVAVQPFIGNLVQESSLRQKGVSTQIGVMTAETTRLGASFAKTSSEVMAMTMYSLDARSGFGKGNSLLFELGQVESAPKGGDKVMDRYALLQNQWLLQRGLYTILTAEMLQPDIRQNDQTYRFGPGIQYFPDYRIELRADVYDSRERSSASYSDDSWTVTGQLHIWF